MASTDPPTPFIGPRRYKDDINQYEELRPTIQEAKNLLRTLYRLILEPAFEHSYWQHGCEVWQKDFPVRCRSYMDLILPFITADQENPLQLRDWLADFIQDFCATEMSLRRAKPIDLPGARFNPAKYGAGLDYKLPRELRSNKNLADWVLPLYAYRNEWAWGVDGGTRGLAGFVEATGMFVFVFTRMLETGWADMKILYERASGEMVEYLYRWAVRVHPSGIEDDLDSTYAQDIEDRYSGVSDQYDDKSHYSQEYDNDDDDTSSVHSADSQVTVVPYVRPATPLDMTDFRLDDDDNVPRRTSWLDREPTSGRQSRLGSRPPVGGTPESAPAPPRQLGGWSSPYEAFPKFEDPAPPAGPSSASGPSSVAGPSSAASGQAPPAAPSVPSAGSSGTPAPAPRRRARARALTNAAELFEADDADWGWYAEHVLTPRP